MRWLMGLAVAMTLGAVARAQVVSRPLIDLARIGSTLQIGAKLGKISAGLLCVPRGYMEWTSGNAVTLGQSADMRDAFREALKAADFRVAGSSTDLFETHTENVELQVGALLTSLHEEVCLPAAAYGNPGARGSGSMSVEWQIYSVTQNKVIGKIQTEASDKASGPLLDGNLRLTRQLFTANARALARSEEFAKLVAVQSVPTAMPADGPATTLAVTMAPAVRPMPLSDASKAVVSIFAGNSMGSGLLISQDGYVLTNHHVAGDAGRVRIRWPDGTNTVGEVIRADKRRDVALVKTTPPKVVALAIRHTPVQLGETVYAIGTPLEQEFSGTLTRGVVSAASRLYLGQVYIQSDVAVDHGNSGGPLLDENGYVVGLTDITYNPDGISHNINFFIPIEEALKVLAVTPAPADSPQVAAAPPKAPAARKR